MTNIKTDGKWMYDFNNSEMWTGSQFDTKEKAIEEGKADLTNDNRIRERQGLKPIKEFYIGKTTAVNACGVDVDNILEDVAENTVDGLEAGEDYLCDITEEHSKELEQKLNDVLFAWMEEHGYEPDFFTIEDVEKITI